ncbi:uncharacterized [Lates japonicus]
MMSLTPSFKIQNVSFIKWCSRRASKRQQLYWRQLNRLSRTEAVLTCQMDTHRQQTVTWLSLRLLCELREELTRCFATRLSESAWARVGPHPASGEAQRASSTPAGEETEEDRGSAEAPPSPWP